MEKNQAHPADITLTKAELAANLFIKINLNKGDKTELISKSDAKMLVDLFFDVLCQKLIDGEEIKLSGFGNFTPRHKNKRIGRNPKTGAAAEITARRVITFSASSKLRDSLQKQ